jgi:hypothetical protein
MNNFLKEFLAFNKLQFLKYDEKIVLYMLFSYGFLGAQEQLGMSDAELQEFQEKSSTILNKLFDKARSQTELETMGFDEKAIERWKTINNRIETTQQLKNSVCNTGLTSSDLAVQLKKVLEEKPELEHVAEDIKKELKWLDEVLDSKIL